MVGDPAGGGAAVAPLALVVGPHLHVDLHEVVGLAPALPQGPPAGHRHDVVDVALAPLGQADRLDRRTVFNFAVKGQDRDVVPLKNFKSVAVELFT